MAELQPMIVFHGRNFVRHLGICNPICVLLLQIMSGAILRNFKKNDIYILNRFPGVNKRGKHTQTETHTDVHTYTDTRTHTYIYRHTDTHIHIQTHRHTHTYTDTQTHTYIYRHTDTHIHIQTYRHTTIA